MRYVKNLKVVKLYEKLINLSAASPTYFSPRREESTALALGPQRLFFIFSWPI